MWGQNMRRANVLHGRQRALQAKSAKSPSDSSTQATLQAASAVTTATLVTTKANAADANDAVSKAALLISRLSHTSYLAMAAAVILGLSQTTYAQETTNADNTAVESSILPSTTTTTSIVPSEPNSVVANSKSILQATEKSSLKIPKNNTQPTATTTDPTPVSASTPTSTASDTNSPQASATAPAAVHSDNSSVTAVTAGEDPATLTLKELFERYSQQQTDSAQATATTADSNSSLKQAKAEPAAAPTPAKTAAAPDSVQNADASSDAMLSKLFDKYSELIELPKSSRPTQSDAMFVIDAAGLPGVILGKEQGKGESAFDNFWPYRKITFEMHIQDQRMLSGMLYSLAVHAKDISPNTPRDKFYKGVSGFHYSVEQICDWLNDPNKVALNAEERGFVQQLLKHKVIVQEDTQYVPGSQLKHVLGASASKKRSFERNLRHERLHIYYDEDAAFRKACVDQFMALDQEQQKEILKGYSNYNQENLPQLIEEWSVGSHDQQPLPKISD